MDDQYGTDDPDLDRRIAADLAARSRSREPVRETAMFREKDSSA